VHDPLNALARFEALIERVVDSSLVGLLGARLEPVEIAKRLVRAMDHGRAIGTSGPIAPNAYVVRLSAVDFARYGPVREALERELQSYLVAAAKQRRLSLMGAPTVRVELEASLRRHQMDVSASFAEPEPASPLAGHTERFAAVVPADDAVPIAKPRVVVTLTPNDRTLARPVRVDRARFAIGRALDNQLVLEDPRISRYHAVIVIDGTACSVRDLESTNGTWVNGIRVREKRLIDGDVVSFGGVEMQVGIVGDAAR